MQEQIESQQLSKVSVFNDRRVVIALIVGILLLVFVVIAGLFALMNRNPASSNGNQASASISESATGSFSLSANASSNSPSSSTTPAVKSVSIMYDSHGQTNSSRRWDLKLLIPSDMSLVKKVAPTSVSSEVIILENSQILMKMEGAINDTPMGFTNSPAVEINNPKLLPKTVYRFYPEGYNEWWYGDSWMVGRGECVESDYCGTGAVQQLIITCKTKITGVEVVCDEIVKNMALTFTILD